MGHPEDLKYLDVTRVLFKNTMEPQAIDSEDFDDDLLLSKIQIGYTKEIILEHIPSFFEWETAKEIAAFSSSDVTLAIYCGYVVYSDARKTLRVNNWLQSKDSLMSNETIESKREVLETFSILKEITDVFKILQYSEAPLCASHFAMYEDELEHTHLFFWPYFKDMTPPQIRVNFSPSRVSREIYGVDLDAKRFKESILISMFDETKKDQFSAMLQQEQELQAQLTNANTIHRTYWCHEYDELLRNEMGFLDKKKVQSLLALQMDRRIAMQASLIKRFQES